MAGVLRYDHDPEGLHKTWFDMDFRQELLRHGPGSNHPTPSLAEARAYCHALATSHYENFSVLSNLTPKYARPHFAAIYAYCRFSDDLGDEVGNREESRRLLKWWEDELRKLYQGDCRHPIMVALAETVKEYAIPPDPFLALLSAFTQDQDVLEYETEQQLLEYCVRSADPVGHLVLYLAQSYNSVNAGLSDKTCTGLQLANFWQDVSRDLEIGRIYLPGEHRARFGVSVESLKRKEMSESHRELLRFEVERARLLLIEGRTLLDNLSGRYRRMVDLYNRGGLAVLDAIETANFETLTSRPRVSKLRKAGLILQVTLGLPPSIKSRPAGNPVTSRSRVASNSENSR